ncbi:MAG: sodium-dependent bicarbonate transport family permease [Terrimicrobiaceae bacterium]
MDLLLQNLLQPPILFFVLGMAAVFLKSDLELPAPLPKVLSLYLLFAIGLHGGASLAKSGFGLNVILPLGAALLLAAVLPVISFFILRTRLSAPDSAAIAAAYGSVSAVTFLAACNFLEQVNVEFGGYMIAALALMEFPAIIVGMLLLKRERPDAKEATGKPITLGHLVVESLLNGSIFLLLGSLVIGFVAGDAGWKKVSPFAQDLFAGVLCLFLLDMGMAVARRGASIRKAGAFPMAFALAFPPVAGSLALVIAWVLKLPAGDSLLLALLAASASYIAVPAVMRVSVPEANPGLYVPMALSLTFPLNVLVGIPVFFKIITMLWTV